MDQPHLPREIMVVPEFVSLVGSVLWSPEPSDIDVLVRGYVLDETMLGVETQHIALPLRNALDPAKSGHLHFIYSPQGSHGESKPLYDLVLRLSETGKSKSASPSSSLLSSPADWEGWPVEVDGLWIDLGCGSSCPPGYVGVDNRSGYGSICWDLRCCPWPFHTESVAVVRAHHILEHLPSKEEAIAEIYRILKPGGIARIVVPSVDGIGAFAHPGHLSYWHRSTFAFWTVPDLVEDRPLFDLLLLRDRWEGSRCYVDVILQKPQFSALKEESITPILRISSKRPLPRPAQRGRAQTDAFDPSELSDWFQRHAGEVITVEPKYNGFRGLVQVDDSGRVSIQFASGEERWDALLKADGRLEKLSTLPTCILDCDVGVVSMDGKRWTRPAMMTLLADEPELVGGRLHIVAFDVLYWDGVDWHMRPFGERRQQLERIADTLRKAGVIEISPSLVVSDLEGVSRAWRSPQFGLRDQSEGIVVKSSGWVYTFTQETDGMAKVKHAVELKVIVLERKRSANGQWGYRGGLLPGLLQDTLELVSGPGKRKFVDVGWSLNTSVQADVGDILTVQVEELLWDGRSLRWLGARVLDVDRERSQPFFVRQAIDLGMRGRILISKESLVVGPSGSRESRLVIVGDGPGKGESETGKIFTGPSGVFLRDALESLVPGIDFDEIYWVNVYDTMEEKSQQADIAGVIKRLQRRLSRLPNMRAILALGREAAEILTNRKGSLESLRLEHVGYGETNAQVVVAWHPAFLLRTGGKSSRLYRRWISDLRRALQLAGVTLRKQREEGDEDVNPTRAAQARRFWEENWHVMFPASGSGRFVYHHHWRGLTKEESEWDEDRLLRTSNSLHGDLRLQSDDVQLWGFTVFLGEAQENISGDRLVQLDSESVLRGTFKNPQPIAWLDVGRRRPLVTQPGGVGATAQTYGKFFAEDWGSYQIGVWHRSFFEIFLEGKKAQGRYIITRLREEEDTDERLWLIRKPKDQRPFAETHDRDETIKRLVDRGHRWLVWGRPGVKPDLIDLRLNTESNGQPYAPLRESNGQPYAPLRESNGQPYAPLRESNGESTRKQVWKVDKERRLVTGVVLDPYLVDLQGDWVSPSSVERAAHQFLSRLSKDSGVWYRHSHPISSVSIVESYCLPYPSEEDYRKAMDGEPHAIYRFKIGSEYVPSGAWVVTCHVKDDKLWRQIKSGELTGFSIGGSGIRSRLKEFPSQFSVFTCNFESAED